MRYQSLKAGCGPTALSNALELLGVKRTEDECSALCGTNANGTDHNGIIQAVLAVGRKSELIETKSGRDAAYALHYSVCRGRPVICCVDSWDHWVVAGGQLGDRLLVLDSASSELCLVYTLQDFLTRWEKKAKRGGGYYGIIVA